MCIASVYLTQILKPQRGDMCIETLNPYTLKPQRGDMCIKYQKPQLGDR